MWKKLTATGLLFCAAALFAVDTEYVMTMPVDGITIIGNSSASNNSWHTKTESIPVSSPAGKHFCFFAKVRTKITEGAFHVAIREVDEVKKTVRYNRIAFQKTTDWNELQHHFTATSRTVGLEFFLIGENLNDKSSGTVTEFKLCETDISPAQDSLEAIMEPDGSFSMNMDCDALKSYLINGICNSIDGGLKIAGNPEESDNAWHRLRQSIPMKSPAGKRFRLEAEAAVKITKGNFTLAIRESDEQDKTIRYVELTLRKSQDLTNISKEFTASGNTVKMQFYVYAKALDADSWGFVKKIRLIPIQ